MTVLWKGRWPDGKAASVTGAFLGLLAFPNNMNYWVMDSGSRGRTDNRYA
jgi:hypothetical protein